MKLSKILSALTGKYAERFVKYGSFSPTPLSLAKLTNFGETADAFKSAKFLKAELPVRLANIMQEIHLLPENLIRTPSVSLVISWYEKSFKELVDFENSLSSKGDIGDFTETLVKIRDRHASVVQTMAEGVMELRERHGVDIITNNQLQYFLDRFYMMRISLRMLIHQHVLLFGSGLDKNLRCIGSIDPNCDVVEVLKDAYEDSKYLCQHYYAGAPELKISFYNDQQGRVSLVYVPSHLYHILFELLKNAMRAVMENPAYKNSSSLPPIETLISCGEEDVIIKLSDLGGGIPRSALDLVFQYTYTTGDGKIAESTERMDLTNAPLAGYGYGLPLSRLYAKYFNGELVLASVEGWGTDALVYLKRHEADADEVLPVFNRTTARQYELVTHPIADWSSQKK